MINVTRRNHVVVIEVTTHIGGLGVKTLEFNFDAGSDLAAALLERHLRRRIGDRIENIRMDEYTSGRRDARSRPARRASWFRSNLEWGTGRVP